MKMKSVKVEKVIKEKENYPILYLRNYSKPSIKQSYKPICEIPNGEEKCKLLLCRWLNCAQIVLESETNLYYE